MIDQHHSETAVTTNPKIDLNSFDDETIKLLIADGYKLLDRRKREREKAVKEQIKALAATEGIKVDFREPAVRKKRGVNDNQINQK